MVRYEKFENPHMVNHNLCDCGELKVKGGMVGLLAYLLDKCDACQLALDRDQKINDILNGSE
jgi:hypothetical protein